MDPQRRLVALWLCRIRALLGWKLVLAPRLVTRLGLGTPSPVATATVRMVGVRDIALGLGAIAGVREGAQAPEWVGWGAVADGVDALALLVTPGLPKRARLVGLVAAGAAAVGMKLAWELADERAAKEIEARHAARLVSADDF
jgi:hypothetical protein